MNDHTTYVENMVRDELAKACVPLGLDKNEVGYSVGGHGNLGLVGTKNGIEPMAHWSIMVSLRSLLLNTNGQRVAASAAVPGVLPTDEIFRAVSRQLLTEVNAQRQREFNGENNGDGKINPFEIRRA